MTNRRRTFGMAIGIGCFVAACLALDQARQIEAAQVSHEDVLSLAISPDHSRVATASVGGEVQMWKLPGWAPAPDLTDLGALGVAVAFSPDGATLAIGNDQHSDVHLVDAKSGELLWSAEPKGDGVASLAFDPAGKFIAAASPGTGIHFLDVRDGAVRRTVSIPDDWRQVQISGDGERLYACSASGTLRVWTAPRLGDVKEFRRFASLMAISPDGKRMAVSLLARTGPRTIRLIRTDTWATETDLAAGTSDLNAIAWSKSGRWLAATCDEGRVTIWRSNSGAKVGELGPTGEWGAAYACAFLGDDRLMVAYSDGKVRAWDIGAYAATGGGNRVGGSSSPHN